MKKEESPLSSKEILKCLFGIVWRLLATFLFIFGLLAFISYQAKGEISLETMKYLGIAFAIAIPIILFGFFIVSLVLRLLGFLKLRIKN